MEEISKYQKLWDYIKNVDKSEILISFEDVKNICGFGIDHSFLRYKKSWKILDMKLKKFHWKTKLCSLLSLVKNKGE